MTLILTFNKNNVKILKVKVFVTDGLAEKTARKQKRNLKPTVWAEPTVLGEFCFFCFLIKFSAVAAPLLVERIFYEKSCNFNGK